MHLRTNCGYPQRETTREEDRAEKAWRPRLNRPVPARAATPDLDSSKPEEWDHQPIYNLNPERPVPTAEPLMPAAYGGLA